MRKLRYSFGFFSILLGTFVCGTAFAESSSLGDVAQNLTFITSGLAKFFMAILFVIGFSCLVGTIVKYKAHRDNPQFIGLTVPITLLFVGLSFVGLGLLLFFTSKTIFGV